MRKIIFIAIAIILVVSTGIYLAAKRQTSSRKGKLLCEEAIVLMEEGDFQSAIKYLEQSLAGNNSYAKAHYALAVSYLRIDPPDIRRAMSHRNRAQKLGYLVPEWFDNYARTLKAKD